MPGIDQTGPAGMGPGTGRGLGRCIGFEEQRGVVFCKRGYGSYYGCGRRLHLQRRRGFGAGTYGRDEKEILENKAAYLEEQLERTRKELDVLRDEQS